MKEILHICNDYLGSKVHHELYSHLDKLNISQTIFVPTRSYINKKKKEESFFKYTNVVYSLPLKKYLRFLFRYKIHVLFKSLEEKIVLKNVRIVHATTLFSDGALALRIYNKYNIPYIVTVRSTDIDIFFKYRPDLILLAIDILKYAQKVIFVSNSLQKKFENHFYRFFFKKYINKSIVINNGIASFWFQNLTLNSKVSPYDILYVGSFLKRKNVLRLIQAVLNLKEIIPHIRLTLVGEGGYDEIKVRELVINNPTTLIHLGPIHSLKQLQNVFAASGIFAMPSYNETFGLVYIEALSQSLPVLYSVNEGIDGLFNSDVGVAVDPYSVNSIEEGLFTIIDNYNKFSINKDLLKNFDWRNIAHTYNNLYDSI